MPLLQFPDAESAQIRRAKVVGDGLHLAGILQVVFHIKGIEVPRRAQQGRQMASGGAAPRAEMRGVQLVFRGMGAQPAHRRFAIHKLRREDGFRAETVIDAGHSIPAGVQAGDRGMTIALVAKKPRPAINPDNDRQGHNIRGRATSVLSITRSACDTGSYS